MRTVRRWEAEQDLPVHRHVHQSSGTVYAFKSELDGWWASRAAELDSTKDEGRPEPAAAMAQPAAPEPKAIALITLLGLLSLAFYFVFARPHTTAPPAPVMLAVLPFENLSGDAGQEYLSDGMTDELITNLARVHSLRVISRTSAMNYKGNRKPLAQIARELKVTAVLDGSVARSGDRVRVSAQLIDAPTDTHLWARSYERDIGDVLVLQKDLARSIVAEISAALTPTEQARLQKAPHITPAGE